MYNLQWQILFYFRVPFIRDGLVPCSPEERNAAPLRNKKILDVGCGGGILSEVNIYCFK